MQLEIEPFPTAFDRKMKKLAKIVEVILQDKAVFFRIMSQDVARMNLVLQVFARAALN